MEELGYNLYTVKQYAEAVNKHERTVRRWIEENKLEARKDRGGQCWLIVVRNVNAFVKKHA